MKKGAVIILAMTAIAVFGLVYGEQVDTWCRDHSVEIGGITLAGALLLYFTRKRLWR